METNTNYNNDDNNNNVCNPANSRSQSACDDGYYILSKDRNRIITNSDENGILYLCENKRCKTYNNHLGYFLNADINSDIKYIKCSRKYYTLKYEKNKQKREIPINRRNIFVRENDSTDDKDNNNTNNNGDDKNNNSTSNNGNDKDNNNTNYDNDKNSTKPKNSYSYTTNTSEQVCEGINITDIDTTCSEVGQLILKNDIVHICISGEGDNNVVAFTDEINDQNRYRVIDGNLLNINVNSTTYISIPKVVIEVNQNYIQIAVGNFFVNEEGVLSSTEGDIGSLYKCYGYWCNNSSNVNVGYYVNQFYNSKSATSSPYIRCSKDEKNGVICKNIKVTKTKCGTNEEDAKEGELFITLPTETNKDNESLNNSNEKEYEPSPYYDGNHYNICLDTSTETPVSLELNSDITSSTSYMIRKNTNNIFGTENNEYGVVVVLQYDVELSTDENYLFKYTDENYKVHSSQYGISEDNICYVGGSLIEFEGNCTFSENGYYVENCNGYTKNSSLNIKTNDVMNNPHLGNLVFYGRGQERLAQFWNENDEIEGSEGIKVYFPKCKDCVEDSEPEDYFEKTIPPLNKPLTLYLPEHKKSDSYIKFHTTYENDSINLFAYHMIKSEIKVISTKTEKLTNDENSCKNNDIPCDEPEEYTEYIDDDFNENSEIRFFLRSEEGKEYEITLDEYPSIEWRELIGHIYNDEERYKHISFTEFVIKNYGTKPVYVLIGNTMFLKKDPTYMVKDGIIQDNFVNWSWHQETANKEATFYANQVYEDDPEQKNCIKFITKEDGDYSYYAHAEKSIGAPEAISFKIRPMNDNKFRLKVDNKKEFDLMEDYLIYRNCDIPIGEESNILIDVRSLLYSNPTYLLNNDITGFWIQTISAIRETKKKIAKEQGEEEAEAYSEVTYFYDFVIHNTYPDDLGQFVEIPISGDDSCNINIETHYDWEEDKKTNIKYPVEPWPEDIDLKDINE